MEVNSLDLVLDQFPERIRQPLDYARKAYEDKVTEITIRSLRPLCIYEGKQVYCITERGYLTKGYSGSTALTVTAQELEQIILRLCDYSVYVYQNEINSGFITIGRGVRAGLCGKAVVTQGAITNVRDISSLSFRIPRDITGCSAGLMKKIPVDEGLLICGSPGCGKTTLLRDIARSLSYRHRVSLLDERGELSGYSRGRSAYDLGLCDIYVGYPKGVAANCAIRSMTPDIIICDEMGDRTDAEMLLYSLRCGVRFIATVHAADMRDLRSREITARLLATGAFRYVVFLHPDAGADRVQKIYEMSDVYA